jgi:hypothetical protein
MKRKTGFKVCFSVQLELLQLGYMCFCAYFSLFRLGMFSFYQLVPKHTVGLYKVELYA